MPGIASPCVVDRIAPRQKRLGDRNKVYPSPINVFKNLFQCIRGVFCIVMAEDDAAWGRF